MRYLPFIEQAIARLAYVRTEYAPMLAILMEEMEGHHPRDVGRAFRQHGTPMTQAGKRENHIPANADFTSQAWQALTEKGRANPVHGLDTLLLDATFRFFRHRAVSAEINIDKPHWYRVDGPFARECEGCARLHNERVEADFIHLIPPVDCQREACALALTLHIDFLAGAN